MLWRIGPEGALVELGKVTHTERKICANRKRPEGSTRTNLGLPLCGFLLESLDIRFGRAGKEEKFVEIPLAHEFCLALGQSDVLGEARAGKARAELLLSMPVSSAIRSSISVEAGCGDATGTHVKRPRRTLRGGFKWK